MAQRWHARMVAGADVDTPATSNGDTLMDLFERGQLGAGNHDPERPYESLSEWLNGEKDVRLLHSHQLDTRPPGLRAFVAERPSGPREPWRMIVGTALVEMDPNQCDAVGITLSQARDALAQVKHAFAGWGLQPKVGLYAIFSDEEE